MVRCQVSAQRLRTGQHPDVLAAAVVAERSGYEVVPDPFAIYFFGDGRVAAAVEVPLFEMRVDLGQHGAGAGDVAVLAAVGGARKGKVAVVEAALVEAAGGEDGESLGGLGCGAEKRNAGRVADGVEDLAGGVDDGGMDAMAVLDDAASVCDDIVIKVCCPRHLCSG